MRHLFSIFLSFWSKIPNHTAWRSHEGSGAHEGQDDTVAPFPLPLQNRSDLPPSLTCPRSRLSNCAAPTTTAFLLRHVFACERQRLLSSTSLPLSSLARFLSSSTPIFALTLVIGWFLTVSLLLLSHSGASVVAVENGYPCLFFFVITQIKIPMN